MPLFFQLENLLHFHGIAFYMVNSRNQKILLLTRTNYDKLHNYWKSSYWYILNNNYEIYALQQLLNQASDVLTKLGFMKKTFHKCPSLSYIRKLQSYLSIQALQSPISEN